jgi:hypothetical protein
MKSSVFSHVDGPVVLRHRAIIVLVLIRWSLTRKLEDTVSTVLRRSYYERHEVAPMAINEISSGIES